MLVTARDVVMTSVTTMLNNFNIYKTKNRLKSSHMIKRILHSWSFHMKFMKLAEGSFNKFHMK